MDNTVILEGIKKAMQAEWDGHNFYKMAAEKTSDETAKNVFDSLAGDELDHLNFLKAQFLSFKKSGKADSNVKLKKPKWLESSSAIFSEDFKKRLGEAHFEVSALSVAAQLELNSINYYRAEADKSTDPTVRDFYLKLADWELSHHRLLIEQQKQIQEDYWFKSNFYPF